MILVDSSVWIRGLMGRDPWAEHLGNLLATQQIVGHELVFGELLMGDNGGRKELLNRYKFLPFAPKVAHSDVVEFVRVRRLAARGAGWTDVHLLAAALVGGHEVWSADRYVVDLALELKVAYAPAFRPR